MLPTARSRNTSAALGAVVCLAIVASIVFFAVQADGREGTESTTNDGGAWLVNQRSGSIGHVNHGVQELSAAVRVSQPGASFEVLQPDGVVLAHDLTANTIEVVDERTHLLTSSLNLPVGAIVDEYSTGIVVVAQEPFRVWRVETGELSSLRQLESVSPIYTADRATAWAMSQSGQIAIDDLETGSVIVVGRDGAAVSWTRDEPADEIIFDGDRPVLLMGQRLATINGDRFAPVGGDVEPWSAVQRSGKDRKGSVVVAASSGRILRIDTDDGNAELVGQLPGADPSPLIDHNGCVFAVTNEPPTYWVRCGEAEPHVTPLQVTSPTRLHLRLVNGWVWINDLRSGNLWVVEDTLELSRIDDWGAVLPQDADPDDLELSSSESEDDIVDEIENPDAEDALTIDADQFDEDDVNQIPVAFDDESETHQGRPVVVDVVANDEDPDNDVLLVSSVENLSSLVAKVEPTIDGKGVQVTPSPEFEGVVRFTYTITDGRGGSDSATGSVTVQARSGNNNRAPIAVTDIGSITVGERLIINVLANDYDPDGDSLVLVAATAQQGNLSFDPGGQIIFEPESTSEEGEIGLDYLVSDDFGELAEGRVRAMVRLRDSNQPPDARNDGGITVVGQPIRLNLLANDSDPDGDSLFVSQRPELLSPTDVDVFTTTTSDGEFVFIPEQAGTFLFSYGVSDEAAADLAQIRVDVSEPSGNSPPIAVRDDIVIPAGQSRIVYALANDGDPDGDVVGIVDFNVTPGSGLRVEQFGDVGFRVFVDEEGLTRRSFSYSISDGQSAPAETMVVIAVGDVTAVNQPPFAQPDSVDIRPGSSVVVPVLENDFDPEGGPLVVADVSIIDGAQAEIGPENQSVRITVGPDTRTSFSLIYDVVDDHDNRTATVVRVRVVPDGEPNRPPVARPDSARTPFDTPLAVPVILNDSDPDGDAIRVESVTAQPLNGVATVDTATGDIVYTPAEGYSGTDRFSYVIVDALGARHEGDVLVGVMPEPRPNRDPIAEDDSFITVATGQSSDLSVLLNDRDPDGDQLRIASFEAPPIGELTRTIDGRQLVFRAPVEQADDESVTFVYSVSDGAGGTAQASVTILVQATPPREEGAPIAVDDEVGPVSTGDEVRVDVIANDSDPDATVDQLSVSVFDPAVRVEGQTVVFAAPPADAEYTYQLTDSDGNQDAAIIFVTVTNQRPPVAVDDQFGPVSAGDVIDVDVLLNDYDLDFEAGLGVEEAGQGLRLVSVVGEGAVIGDQVVRITAPAESAQYTYTISDVDGLEATARISLIVTDNRAPILSPQAFTTLFQEPIEIDLSTAATDPDGDALFFSCCLTARGGSPTVLDAGEGLLIVDFTPDDSFSGDAVFSYEVDDRAGHVVAGSVTVTVEAQPNRPPTAVSTEMSIQAPRPNAPSVATDLDLGLFTDDPDGDPLIWALSSGPGQGLEASIDGAILIVAATDQAEPGVATITWTATDPEGASVTGEVSVTVAEPQNEPPSAAASTVAIPAGNTAEFDLGTLVTDGDADEVLTFDIGSLESNQITATRTGDSTVTFAAVVNAAGTGTTLDYVVTDRMGEVGTAVLTVEVGEPVQDPPTAVADTAGTLQEVSVDVAVLANDADPLGEGLTVVDPGTSDDGAVELSGATITFTPAPGFFGTTSFLYTIGDASELDTRQSSAAVTVEVIGRPDAPSPPVCTPDSTFVALTWTGPANNGASVDDYEIQHDQEETLASSLSTNHTWRDLKNGTEYRFRVAARNVAGLGDFSEWSLPCQPDIEPEQPAQPQVSHGDGILVITWSKPLNNGSEILDYAVRMAGGQTITVEDALEYEWGGLINGSDHTFEVAARNTKGLSDFSIPSIAEHPSKPPNAPTIQATTRAGLIGASASGQLQVNWTPVPVGDDGGDTIDHYLIERRPSASSTPQALGANEDRYLWSGLRNGEDFEFRVIAVNRDGPGQPSAWSPPLRACTVPGVPTSVSAVRADKAATVTFAKPNDNGGCTVGEYRVRVIGTTGPGVLAASPGSVSMTGLENGETYGFEVQAINTLGGSDWVGSNAVTPAGPPICPDTYRVLTISRGGTTVQWSDADFNGALGGRYERVGISGVGHDAGLGNVELLPAWSEGTHTLRLDAVTDLGRDSCGSITFTTCPTNPPQMPAPPIGPNQIIKRIALPNLRLPTNYIGCLTQPEVTGDFRIEGLQVFTEVLSVGGGTVQTDVAVGDDVIYGPGLPPGYEIRSRIRACYPGDICGTWSAWTAAVKINPEVTLSQGNRRTRTGCNNPCDDLVVNLAGFAPNEQVTIVSDTNTGRGNWCGTWTVTVNASGSGSFEEHCWFGFWGETVWVVADGIQSNGVVWSS